MDTTNFCVYNLARRVFLSSKVTVADTVNQPLKVLKDLVAMDAESGLWLKPLYAKPTIPKLFPYDLAYLDEDFQVVETIEVAPGVDFPPHRREMTSAVVLPPETLRSTQTGVGDRLVVCPQQEIDKRISEADRHPKGKEDRPMIPAEAGTAVLAPGVSSLDADKAKVGVEVSVRNGKLPVAQQSAEAPTAPPPVSTAAKDPVKPAEPGARDAHSVSITEVVIEQPHEFSSQVQSNPAHPAEVEDLFANWVDSRSASPSWIAQKMRESMAGSAQRDPVKAQTAEPRKSRAKESVGVRSPAAAEPTPAIPPIEQKAEESENPAPGKESQGPAPEASPAKAPPIAPRIPQSTFTIGQFGIWQLSTPTVILPKRPPAAGTQAKGGSGSRRGQKPTAPKKTGDVRAASEATTLPVTPKTTWAAKAPSSEEAPKAEKVLKPENAAAAEAAPTTEIAAKAETAPAAEHRPATPPEIKKIDVKPAQLVPAIEILPPKMELPEPKPGLTLSKESSVPVPAARQSSTEIQAPRAPSAPIDKVTEVQRKATPPDVAATIQEKLERLLQTRPAASVTPSPATPSPASRTFPSSKKIVANSQPATGMRPTAGNAAEKTSARTEDKKNSGEQLQDLAKKLPLPSFLKPKAEQDGKPGTSPQRLQRGGKNGTQPQSFGARLKHWFSALPSTKDDRRRALRRYVPGMVAHYYTGGAPKPHEIADISLTGLYLLTDDRWVPDTMIRMTLQKPCAKGDRKQSITVLSRIVRRGTDGIAAEFVMQESLDSNTRDVLPSQGTDRFSLARFL